MAGKNFFLIPTAFGLIQQTSFTVLLLVEYHLWPSQVGTMVTYSSFLPPVYFHGIDNPRFFLFSLNICSFWLTLCTFWHDQIYQIISWFHVVLEIRIDFCYKLDCSLSKATYLSLILGLKFSLKFDLLFPGSNDPSFLDICPHLDRTIK